MLINEGGLIRAIKRAYKAGGYTVLNTGNDVAIYTDHWFAMANRALLPRKVLATIVEHVGMIPERDMPTSIIQPGGGGAAGGPWDPPARYSGKRCLLERKRVCPAVHNWRNHGGRHGFQTPAEWCGGTCCH